MCSKRPLKWLEICAAAADHRRTTLLVANQGSCFLPGIQKKKKCLLHPENDWKLGGWVAFTVSTFIEELKHENETKTWESTIARIQTNRTRFCVKAHFNEILPQPRCNDTVMFIHTCRRNGTEPDNNAHKSALRWSQLVQLEKYCGRQYNYS